MDYVDKIIQLGGTIDHATAFLYFSYKPFFKFRYIVNKEVVNWLINNQFLVNTVTEEGHIEYTSIYIIDKEEKTTNIKQLAKELVKLWKTTGQTEKYSNTSTVNQLLTQFFIENPIYDTSQVLHVATNYVEHMFHNKYMFGLENFIRRGKLLTLLESKDDVEEEDNYGYV